MREATAGKGKRNPGGNDDEGKTYTASFEKNKYEKDNISKGNIYRGRACL